jgi:hypothetical protein
VYRATCCAIAGTAVALNGEKKCTGRPTAPILARYRCFLPDLAGLAGLRRVGPGTRSSLPSPTHPGIVAAQVGGESI